MSLAEDRRGISSLHGLSHVKSTSDASDSPELSKGVNSVEPDPLDRIMYWKQNPTIIKPGSAQKNNITMPKPHKPGGNPYNFTNSARGGNTKSQVLVTDNGKGDGPRKHRKLEIGSTVSSNSFFTSKHFPNENGNISRSKNSINLNNNLSSSNSKSTAASIFSSSPLSSPPKEDIGIAVSHADLERSSADPLDLIRPDKEEDLHPFRQQDTPRRTSAGAPDGASTQRLRARLHVENSSTVLSSSSGVINVDADDSIEDADSFLPKNDVSEQRQYRAMTPNGQTHFIPNSVQEKVSKINQQDTAPFIDLNKINTSRVKKMKPRGKAKDHIPQLCRPPPLQMRDATTSFTNYRNTSEDVWLPVSHWSIETTIHTTNDKSHYFLHWEKDSSVAVLTQERLADENYKVHHELPFSMIMSYKWSKTGSDPFVQIDIAMSPESSYRGVFSFKFDSRSLDMQNYHGLVTSIGKHCSVTECLDHHGVKAAWSIVENEAIRVRETSQIFNEFNTIGKHMNPAQVVNVENYTKEIVSRPRPRPAKRKESSSPAPPSQVLRRSSRQASVQNPTPYNNDEIILVYPPSGSGGVNICGSDLKRLQPGEFLNDTLIELGLKFWLNDLRQTNPRLADEIHVFNSFFYKKLNVKNINEGYKSIRKWTMKFDLFRKKYVIVPINEHMHWYLSIICFPEHVLRPPPPKVVKVSTRAGKRKFGDDFTVEELPQILSATHPNISPPSSEQTTSSHDAVELIIKPTGECSITDEESIDPTSNMDVDEESKSRKSTDTDNYERLSWGGMEGGGPASQTVIPDSEDDSNEEQVDQLIDDDTTDTILLNKPESRLDSPVETSTNLQSNGVTEAGSSTSLGNHMDIESPSTSPLLLQDVEISKHTDSGSLSAVAPAKFYASKARTGLNTASYQSNVYCAPEDADEAADDETVTDDMSFTDEASTYIFTLDSLGSRHPQAIKVLRTFLQLEAKDKKNLEETSAAVGKMASVPTQPNYCDCGLYLLHFVRVFMSDPEKVVKRICSQSTKNATENNSRRELWKAGEVDFLRGDMATRILQESETWKKEKAKKSAEAKASSADGTADKHNNVSPADEDEDIVIQGTVIKAPAKGGRGKKSVESSSKTQSAEKSTLQPATRLRG